MHATTCKFCAILLLGQLLGTNARDTNSAAKDPQESVVNVRKNMKMKIIEMNSKTFLQNVLAITSLNEK